MNARDDITTWFDQHLPADLYAGTPTVTVDRDEVVVVGDVPEVTEGADAAAAVADFRERTRERRMSVASQAEETFGRKVSWGARAGGTERMFTHLAVPAMTRLRMSERQLLDVLVEAGVARSRSEALAWCVALVGDREQEWLVELRDSLAAVRAARARGPQPGSGAA
ncbi:hypothetical protein GCM10009623_20880 [Nocardioides aestuarii]|uniref:Uncharacterized protein n=1 Tax=Nocardioides aestuarii TaxID=252231 RepID=A0ABW4TKP4_9ACTN